MRTLRKGVLLAAKWAWVACVAVAGAYLLARSWDDIVHMLAKVSPGWMAGSILLTVLAKAALAENARIAAGRNGIVLPFARAARLYNLSQLGKYLPGSIWQFVGRAAAYRGHGADYGPIRDALLVESLWVVGGAAAFGVLLAGPGVLTFVSESLDTLVALWLVGGVVIVTLAAGVTFAMKRELALRYARIAMPSVRVVLVQASIWGLLGAAFWVLARACNLDVPLLFAAGLFAVAYAVGFLVPFAPAGLGVRDAVLTLGLLPYVPAGEALVVTILARLIYLLVDVGLVLVQEPLFTAFGTRDDASKA